MVPAPFDKVQNLLIGLLMKSPAQGAATQVSE
jgi:hypothetical protein